MGALQRDTASPRGPWAYVWPGLPLFLHLKLWGGGGGGEESQTQPFRLKPTGSNGAQIPPHSVG